jgi:hypothetical protein
MDFDAKRESSQPRKYTSLFMSEEAFKFSYFKYMRPEIENYIYIAVVPQEIQFHKPRIICLKYFWGHVITCVAKLTEEKSLYVFSEASGLAILVHITCWEYKLQNIMSESVHTELSMA